MKYFKINTKLLIIILVCLILFSLIKDFKNVVEYNSNKEKNKDKKNKKEAAKNLNKLNNIKKK